MLRISTLGLALSCVSVPLPCQLPDGTVVSVQFEETSWTQGPGSGPGSLNLVHPLTRNRVSVPGLPVGITGPGTPSTSINGAMSVAVRESDGLVAVGEVNENQGQSLGIHLLQFQGYTLVQSRRIVVGTVQTSLFANTPFGTIDQLAFLPDGNLVYCCRGVAGYTNTPIGRLDVTAGTATPQPVTLTPSGTVNALCASRDGSKVYFGTFDYLGNAWQSEFWETSPTGGNIRSITVRNGIVSGMVTANDGRILATMFDNTQNIGIIDPLTNSQQTIFTNINTSTSSYSLNSIGYEPGTGNILVVTNGTDTRLFRVTPSGNATDLGQMGTGWPSGVATLPDPRLYGAATERPGQAYHFEVSPSPGGFPRVGNAQFGLQIEGPSVNSAPGVLGISLRQLAPTPQFGVQLLIDPTALLTDAIPLPGPPPGQGTIRAPFPIPANGSLRGLQLYVQALFVNSSGAAATEGLALTIL